MRAQSSAFLVVTKLARKLTALAEQIAPLIIGLIVFFVHYRFATTWLPKEANDLLSNTINLSGIAVGFLATGQALLCSLSDNFVVKILKEHKRFDHMLRYFTWAIFLCLLLALSSLAGYAIDVSAVLIQKPYLFSLWLGIFAAAATATLRVLILFSMILHR